MGAFIKVLITSIFIAYIAVKWTGPSFDPGKLYQYLAASINLAPEDTFRVWSLIVAKMHISCRHDFD